MWAGIIFFHRKFWIKRKELEKNVHIFQTYCFGDTNSPIPPHVICSTMNFFHQSYFDNDSCDLSHSYYSDQLKHWILYLNFTWTLIVVAFYHRMETVDLGVTSLILIFLWEAVKSFQCETMNCDFYIFFF